MESSIAFSPPHSCDFCQKLVLYKRNIEWWKRALGTSQDVEAHIEGLLSMRARTWLLEKMNVALWEQSRSTPLPSLEDCAIFDCTLGEARLAANAGCNFCLAIIDRPPAYDRPPHNVNEFLVSSHRRHCFGILNLVGEKGMRAFEVNRTHTSESFEIFALPDNPASREILMRPINLAPSSKASFHQVQEWRQECLETHQTCPKPAGKFMPTRVLEIVKRAGRKDSQLRLIETSSINEPEPYAALSYCWGGPQHITTTIDSYRRHSLIIDKQALQASVRDAVLVAENIGIRYLWIDAFCILQDDQNDKNWEIVQMPLIYSQATVTIVASRARGVADGFLHERPSMGADTPDQVFKLPFRCSDNTLGSVVLLPYIDSPTEPLDLRAWPLQERFLSPRIIEYGSLQTRWICQTLSERSSPIDGFKNTSVYNEERSDYLFTRALQNILATSESINLDKRRRDLLGYWDQMLKVYTHRALTRGIDRLPAISGIAAHFGKSLGDEYKAGLWRSDIESQLLWKRFKPFYRRDLKLRPLQYQGPSWSWAAINEPIDLSSGMSDGDSLVDFEVLDYNIKLPSTSARFSVYDPSFGAVESASLQLRGRLGPVECTYVKRTSDTGADQWIFKTKHDAGPEENLCATFHLDALEAEFASTDSRFMPVFLAKVFGPIPKGLILRHIEGSNFSRLGVFFFPQWGRDKSPHKEQMEWLNNSPIETITLI